MEARSSRCIPTCLWRPPVKHAERRVLQQLQVLDGQQPCDVLGSRGSGEGMGQKDYCSLISENSERARFSAKAIPFSPAQHLVGFLLALLGLLDLIQGLEGARGQLDRPGTTVWGGKDKQSTPGHMDTAINEMAHALTRRTYCSEPANVASICASCSGPGWPLIGCMISSTKGRPSPSMRTSASSRPPMRVQKGEDMPYCR